MKVLALADIHLRAGFGSEEADALLKVADIALEREVDVVLVNGDVFEAKSTPEQRLVFKEFLNRLQRRHTRVSIIRGNHDEAQDLKIFEDIPNNIWVHEEPGELCFPMPHGFTLNVHTIPHFNAGAIALEKSNLGDVEEEGTNVFQDILSGIFQKVKNHQGPSLVTFHGVVSGAHLDNGYIPRQNGIHLNIDSLLAIGCPIIGGHYHSLQNVAKHQGYIYYSGSLTRQTYGEAQGDKGVLLMEYRPFAEHVWDFEFISLEPTPIYLIEAQWLHNPTAEPNEHKYYLDFVDPPALDSEFYRGARVRVRYHVSQSLVSTVNFDLQAPGELLEFAKEVKVERIVNISTAVRCEEMQFAETIYDCVKVWAQAKGEDPALIEEAIAVLKGLMDEEPTHTQEPQQASLLEFPTQESEVALAL